MTTLTISPDSPLHHLGRSFLQHFVNRVIPGLSPPGELDDAAQEAHDQEALALLESLNPRTPVEAAIAAQFLTAHYGSTACSRTAMDCPRGSRDATRLHATAGSLGRVMFQALGVLRRLQTPERAPQRRPRPRALVPGDPMPSGNDEPANAGDAASEQRYPMPSGNDEPANAGDAASEQRDPMPSGKANPTWRNYAAAERHRPMSSGNDTPPGTGCPA